jgi:hypothetical protein
MGLKKSMPLFPYPILFGRKKIPASGFKKSV